jgi:uncharacterized protein (DUF927 family)
MIIDLDDLQNLTAQEIISADMIEALYEIESKVDRRIKIAEVEKIAKKLKVLTPFRELVKAQEQTLKEGRAALKEQKKEEKKQEVQNGFNNEGTLTLKDDNIVSFKTGKWIVDNTGVYYMYGVYQVKASHYPIIITQRFTDRETGKEELEATWIKDGCPHSMKVARSILASSSRIVNLSDYGFPADSENARNLVSYLSEFEKLNPDVIRKRVSTSKFGWIDKDFMPYSEGDIVFNVPLNAKPLADSVKTFGEFETWLNLVKVIRASGRPEPLVYMAASFGSVLVPIIHVMPFIVNLYGGSGKGKTVNLMLAASVWASPKSFITESTSTLNSFEQRLNVLNNLPMMIDDLSKIRDRGDGDRFSDMIYMLCAGQGKGRLNKNIEMRDTATWSNAILTNIERPLATDTMQGGAINRVLDFEIQEGNIFADGKTVVTIILNNYGYAGKIFVDAVRNDYDSINQLVEGYETEIKKRTEESGHEKEQKQISPLALLLAADELAEKHIFKDGIRLDIQYCIDCLKDVENVSEMERALKHIEDEVVMNRMNYFPDSNDNTYRGKIYGYVEENRTYFIKSAFEEIAKKYNFSSKQFLSWADGKGILLHEKGRKDMRVKIPTLDKYQHCFVLKSDNTDDIYKLPPIAAKHQREKLEKLNNQESETLKDGGFN